MRCKHILYFFMHGLFQWYKPGRWWGGGMILPICMFQASALPATSGMLRSHIVIFHSVCTIAPHLSAWHSIENVWGERFIFMVAHSQWLKKAGTGRYTATLPISHSMLCSEYHWDVLKKLAIYWTWCYMWERWILLLCIWGFFFGGGTLSLGFELSKHLIRT